MDDLTPIDREKLSQLETLGGRVRHAYAMVERFASAPGDADALAGGLRRTFGQLKLQFTTAGFDRLSQFCGTLETTARRGMSHVSKVRSLRDGVGTLTRQIDIEKRSIATRARREPRQAE